MAETVVPVRLAHWGKTLLALILPISPHPYCLFLVLLCRSVVLTNQCVLVCACVYTFVRVCARARETENAKQRFREIDCECD